MMVKPGFNKLLGLLEFTWLSKSVVGNDDRKSLTEYASKPVKSQPRGPYSAEVRFAWKTQCKCQGYVWSQSRRSLDNILWAIITLMDFDCGLVSKRRVDVFFFKRVNEKSQSVRGKNCHIQHLTGTAPLTEHRTKSARLRPRPGPNHPPATGRMNEPQCRPKCSST